METMRDQLAEALYQKGLALSEIEKAKVDIRIFNFSDFFIFTFLTNT